MMHFSNEGTKNFDVKDLCHLLVKGALTQLCVTNHWFVKFKVFHGCHQVVWDIPIPSLQQTLLSLNRSIDHFTNSNFKGL